MGFLTKNEKIKVYKCELCGTKILITDTEKIFNCPTCGRSYEIKDNSVIITKEGWEDKNKDKDDVREDVKNNDKNDDNDDDIFNLEFY